VAVNGKMSKQDRREHRNSWQRESGGVYHAGRGALQEGFLKVWR